MAFWHRIRNSNLKTLYSQFHRSFTHHLPHSSFSNSTPKTPPIPLFQHKPSFVFNSVRFYAVPVQFQVKPKNEEDDSDGPRLNDQIKAKFVRLVLDDGHSVVSRFEALERAKKLKFDLVEVDKNAKPPVCKIMDFHKEMYKKKENDKERAKSKSEMTMRKECKEVRFSEKTESKDLKMKADMVRKLMDKGYRVKVKATGNADQAMLNSISRISALIEDVCIVESGPHLTKKEAYMIVRHLKYGPAKKGVKKSQDAVLTDVKAEEEDVEPLTANSSDSINYKNQSSPEYQLETQETVISHGNKQFPFSADRSDKSVNDRNDSVSPPVLENRYKKANNRGEDKVQPNAQVPPVVTENRYKKTEPRNRSQQTTPNTNPATRDTNRWTPSNSNHPSGSRSPMPSRDNIHPNPRGPNTKSPGYGLFSRDA
ncbi:translation initiation factor IF3-1, mitochondrial-like [Vicia villosa]|uniref:translation initiation factor IF3-1, mitochondrial-like n=1 Tax=Vicia villosa TaxID=3911 RepID=UPI00273ACFB9|nr:translation initiation factor IF3-1, mitochondrial-like [Vicia villosa]